MFKRFKKTFEKKEREDFCHVGEDSWWESVALEARMNEYKSFHFRILLEAESKLSRTNTRALIFRIMLDAENMIRKTYTMAPIFKIFCSC